MEIGDRVWYWARRKDEKTHKKVGQIVALSDDKTLARVALEGFHPVPIQAVEVKRLNKTEE